MKWKGISMEIYKSLDRHSKHTEDTSPEKTMKVTIDSWLIQYQEDKRPFKSDASEKNHAISRKSGLRIWCFFHSLGMSESNKSMPKRQ